MRYRSGSSLARKERTIERDRDKGGERALEEVWAGLSEVCHSNSHHAPTPLHLRDQSRGNTIVLAQSLQGRCSSAMGGRGEGTRLDSMVPGACFGVCAGRERVRMIIRPAEREERKKWWLKEWRNVWGGGNYEEVSTG